MLAQGRVGGGEEYGVGVRLQTLREGAEEAKQASGRAQPMIPKLGPISEEPTATGLGGPRGPGSRPSR